MVGIPTSKGNNGNDSNGSTSTGILLVVISISSICITASEGRMSRQDVDWIYFDCDDTLVMWHRHHDTDFDEKHIAIKFGRTKLALVPHEEHIRILKQYHEDGWKVVIWSAGGQKWARAVTRALGLRKYVHHVLAKPRVYVDDLHCSQFMDVHLYKPYGLEEEK